MCFLNLAYMPLPLVPRFALLQVRGGFEPVQPGSVRPREIADRDRNTHGPAAHQIPTSGFLPFIPLAPGCDFGKEFQNP